MAAKLYVRFAMVIIAFVFSTVAHAQECPGGAGCLDPTFGTGGVVTYSLTSAAALPENMAAQADGKVVSTIGGSSLVRINSDGSLDTTFGSGGVATFVWAMTSGSHTYYGSGGALALQNVAGEERIIVAGTGHLMSGRKVVSVLRVGRFMPDGTVDASFGTNGSSVINTESANYVTVQPDGKILTLSFGGIVARLNSNGSLDNSFGSGGLLNVSAGYTNEIFHTLVFALDPLGRILVCGDVTIGKGSNARTVISVKRYSPAGVADTAFGTSGSARADFGNTPFAGEIGTDSAGNIVVRASVSDGVTASGRYFAAARFTSNGLLDTSFAGTGKVMFLGGKGTRRGLIFQPDGKIILTGRLNEDYALVRYNYNGTLDTGFGNGGSVIVNVDGPDVINASVLQMDPLCGCSKVVIGSSGETTPPNTSFARFLIE